MSKKIVSFGDSFIFGSQIPGNTHGQAAWPGLIANRLNIDYETCAQVGCGNEAIARQIFTYFSKNPQRNTLAVINWTWSMRWDFYLADSDTWVTLGPTCSPYKLYQHVNHHQAQELINFYNKYTGVGDTWNQYRSLQAMYATQQFLLANNIPNIQTYMDKDLFSKTNQGDRLEHYNAVKSPEWPEITSLAELEQLPDHIKQELDLDYHKIIVPNYIDTLQNLVQGNLLLFEDQTFLEWSKNRGYPVTPSPRDHPLKEAHENAANLWYDHYRAVIECMVE
jgi:hypothetical protein